MVQLCPRCSRANPNEATFCYHDGVILRQPGAGGPLPSQLPREFVFPSGRRCRSYDDLLQGCQYEWEDARDLLRRGEFSRYLTGIGRLDLARAAQEAQLQPDADIALHNFLSSLPAGQVQGPRLDLSPRRLNLADVRAGEQRQLRLLLVNEGKGILQGKVSVSEGREWLRLPEAPGGHLPVKTAREQQVVVGIDARGLPGLQSYSGKLTAITNGGIAEVPVRLDLVATPFPRPPFQGASSPREMAERMRANPKQAVPVLESGDVARWFEANGWAYPVAGLPARGVAAVQQFFESMGLSKPPPIELSDAEMSFLCAPPEVVRGQVVLRTQNRKWVYAQIDSDVTWLKVHTPQVSGPQQAAIDFEVDASVLDDGRVYEGTLRVVANGGQTLLLRVRADVRRPRQPFLKRLLRPFWVGLAVGLLSRLLLAVPADLCGRLAGGLGLPPGATPDHWLEAHQEGGFLRLFVLATWWLGGVAGILLVWQKGGRWSDLFGAAVAGAGAGLAGAGTAGCLVVVADLVPRLLLTPAAGLQSAHPAPWLWGPLWVALAAATWAVAGGLAGLLLGLAGQAGARLVAAAAAPFAWLCRLCGLRRAAGFFALQG